jgi:glucose-6-phosphate 1-dehydrogenase
MSSRAVDCVLVIFGASGDLTRRKLLPAIYNLAETGLIPARFAIVGVARPSLTEADFRQQMRDRVTDAEGEPLEAEKWTRIEERLHYVSGEFHDDRLYQSLGALLSDLGARYSIPPNYLFYFAIPPDLFPTVADRLAASGLANEGDGWRRVIVEKPFGYDLESARTLNAIIHEVFDESQVFRIDHYLGKETVQNILVFRFANSLFERAWNREAIDHIQITVAESIGVETRGSYYEESGAIRDIVQNHLLQVLSFLAMEPPRSLDPEAIRDETVKLLSVVRPLNPEEVVRGQYAAGVIDGEQVPGYREEGDVAPDSDVETYAAVRAWIDNWRWSDVPIFLRTGKRLAGHATEIAVVFQRPPAYLFEGVGLPAPPSDHLVIRIAPTEGISFDFQAKKDGPGFEPEP